MKSRKLREKLIFSVLILIISVHLIKADVAPDPDEVRVSSPLTINTSDDLSDYRFFVDFMGAVHEIEIKNRAQTIVPTPGGGARYSSGTVLAIPKKSLGDFPGKLELPYAEENKAFADSIKNKNIPGIIELTRHRFSATIKKREADNWSYPTYRLEKNGETLVIKEEARIKPQISREGGFDFSVYSVNKGLTIAGWIVIVVVPFSLLLLGIWLFRKRARKSL